MEIWKMSTFNKIQRKSIFYQFTLAGLLFCIIGCKAGSTGGAANSIFSSNFVWGTEIALIDVTTSADLKNKILNAVNNNIKAEYVKIRFNTPSAVLYNDPSYDPRIYSPRNETYNLDEIAQIFETNGWSMLPMISYGPFEEVNSQSMSVFAEYILWFVSEYKEQANIKYIELQNFPGKQWKGTPEQLAQQNTLVYNKVKPIHPDVMIGTPGFEYFSDQEDTRTDGVNAQVEAFFNENVKFDFWAFHGYPTRSDRRAYSPTTTAQYNPYTGVKGILEVRRRLDASGHAGVPIIDTENTFLNPQHILDDEIDHISAAYMTQDMLLKLSLQYDGKAALGGLIPLKVKKRCEGTSGECAWASLDLDASLTLNVSSVGLLREKLEGYAYKGRLSGEFDQYDIWIEAFEKPGSTLLVYFKPFSGNTFQLSLNQIDASFALRAKEPSSQVILGDLRGNLRDVSQYNTFNLKVGVLPEFIEFHYEDSSMSFELSNVDHAVE